jgi:hypothetical protein
MPTNPTVAALRNAARGLLYPSETDAPFKTFLWEGAGGDISAREVLRLGKQPPDAPVEESSLDDTFGELIDELEGQGEEEKEEAARYRNLLKVLREQLSGIKVFRVGQRKISVYVVGKTKDGHWAGLQTISVET